MPTLVQAAVNYCIQHRRC